MSRAVSRRVVWVLLGALPSVVHCESHKQADGDGAAREDRVEPALGVLGNVPDAPALLGSGAQAPDFLALAHTGAKVHLQDLIDKPVLLVFYEANGSKAAASVLAKLADAWLLLQPKLEMVVTVGPHNAVEQAAYATEKQWPFVFLADPDGALARAYGVGHAKAPAVSVLVGPDRKIIDAGPSRADEAHRIEGLLDSRER